MTKEQEFILAVRRLEKEYGLYLTYDADSVWLTSTPVADSLWLGEPSGWETLETLAKEQGLL